MTRYRLFLEHCILNRKHFYSLYTVYIYNTVLTKMKKENESIFLIATKNESTTFQFASVQKDKSFAILYYNYLFAINQEFLVKHTIMFSSLMHFFLDQFKTLDNNLKRTFFSVLFQNSYSLIGNCCGWLHFDNAYVIFVTQKNINKVILTMWLW